MKEHSQNGRPETASDAFPRAGTVFVEIGAQGQQDPTVSSDILSDGIRYIPKRVKKAGELLRSARLRHNVSAKDIGNYLPSSMRNIEGFENGVVSLDLDRVFSSAQRWIDVEDPFMTEFGKIVEEGQWVRTLTKDGMSLGLAITLLRLAKLQTKRQFAKKSQTSEHQLGAYELNQEDPHHYELNQIIAASGLDPMSMPAQIIRLLKEKRPPMELAQLQSCTFGELFRYIRQLKGASQRDAAKVAGVSQSAVRRTEAGEGKPKKNTLNKLFKFLTLDENSELKKIALSKADTPQALIPDDSILKVITGKHDGNILFAESLEEFGSKNLIKETAILKKLEAKKENLVRHSATPEIIIGALLRHLREQLRLNPGELAQHASMQRANLMCIERGDGGVPKDYTLAKILSGMEYTIHHPAAWYLLNIANPEYQFLRLYSALLSDRKKG